MSELTTKDRAELVLTRFRYCVAECRSDDIDMDAMEAILDYIQELEADLRAELDRPIMVGEK